MKETQLVDEYGEPAAISVELKEVAELAKQICTNGKVSVHYDDYDDYGCEHYVLIEGKCANIRIMKDYGGMFCPANFLVCSVNAHGMREDKSSTFKYKDNFMFGGVATSGHSFEYALKESVSDLEIASDYETKLRNFFNNTKQYLAADRKLFYRIDRINHPDLRGSKKWGNGITSYDDYRICDDDFYTSDAINFNAKRTLIKGIDAADFEGLSHQEILNKYC